jgi:hypothetical protein
VYYSIETFQLNFFRQASRTPGFEKSAGRWQVLRQETEWWKRALKQIAASL